MSQNNISASFESWHFYKIHIRTINVRFFISRRINTDGDLDDSDNIFDTVSQQQNYNICQMIHVFVIKIKKDVSKDEVYIKLDGSKDEVYIKFDGSKDEVYIFVTVVFLKSSNLVEISDGKTR